MSRVAKNPVNVPPGIDINIAAGQLKAKGPMGELVLTLHPLVNVEQRDGVVLFAPRDDTKPARALAGTMRALVNNMVLGVASGFQRTLQIVGVGYRAQAQGDTLNLSLGFSHPVVYKAPPGIDIQTPSQTEIVVRGADKQRVGQVAAEIRHYRPPEPYKGKGVRYSDERVLSKQAKKK